MIKPWLFSLPWFFDSANIFNPELFFRSYWFRDGLIEGDGHSCLHTRCIRPEAGDVVTLLRDFFGRLSFKATSETHETIFPLPST